mmetsp:Transcript_5239/g.16152  ORF Transcript_5239/g.16152 Transcript_5239/m.16152 type:complete len:134 (+) Transcript_5239:78-479(+)
MMGFFKCGAVLMMVAPVVGVQVATEGGAPCPSTKLSLGVTKNAAGETTYVDFKLPTPGKCMDIGSKVPKDGTFKICGPGKFTMSRMTCDQHDYKKIEIDQPKTSFTASTCQTYSFSSYYPIDGYIGSMQYSCE